MDKIKTCKYIVALIRALLKNEKPMEKPDDISFEDIYQMAKYHQVLSMCLFAIEKLDHKPEAEIMQAWEKRRLLSTVQSSVQLSERDKILHSFHDNEIRCLPLKGCLMKEMYPKPEYREMSDLDLLLDTDCFEKAESILENLGYEVDHASAVHENYRKQPFMNVELHFSLFSEGFMKAHNALNDKQNIMLNPWVHAHETELKHIYQFSWEDFYIYMFLHLVKHLESAGIGIRQFIDLWVFRQNHELDNNYLQDTFDQFGLLQLYLDIEDLVSVWMSCGQTPKELIELESYVFDAGVYGTYTNKITNRIVLNERATNGKLSAISYLMRRTFIPLKTMKRIYPILNKYPVLLPGMWAHRIFTKFIHRDSHALKEFKMFKEYYKNKSE